MKWPSHQQYVNPVCTWWLVLFQLLSFYINSPPSHAQFDFSSTHLVDVFISFVFLNLFCFCSLQDMLCIPYCSQFCFCLIKGFPLHILNNSKLLPTLWSLAQMPRKKQMCTRLQVLSYRFYLPFVYHIS